MRKKYKILILFLVVILLVIAYKKYFFTFNSLSHGTYFIGLVASPSGNYTADSYFKTWRGATGGAHVWVENTNHENNEVRTIYYSDGKSHFSMEWKNDNVIHIRNDDGLEYPDSSRSIELVIGKEIYDESGRACDSLIMKDEYETCYQK